MKRPKRQRTKRMAMPNVYTSEEALSSAALLTGRACGTVMVVGGNVRYCGRPNGHGGKHTTIYDGVEIDW